MDKYAYIYTVVVQLPSCAQLFATPWTAACQASLALIISCSLPKFMSLTLVMPSSHLILWHPLLLLCSVFLIRDFSSESSVCIRWPKYWPFICSWVLTVNILGWFAIAFSSGSHFVRTLCYDPFVLGGWPCTAWLIASLSCASPFATKRQWLYKVQVYPVPKFSSFLGNIRSQFGHGIFMESNPSFDSRVHFRQLDAPRHPCLQSWNQRT